MSWFTSLNNAGHITQTIIHFNRAIDSHENRISKVEISRCFSDALNKIQTEWLIHQDKQEKGKIKAFREMILDGMDKDALIELMNCDELRNFVLFEPQIMYHDTSRKHRYRPDQEIEPQLVKKASEEWL